MAGARRRPAELRIRFLIYVHISIHATPPTNTSQGPRLALLLELALKGKFTNDAAVANELWGTFAFEVLGDTVEAKHRLTDALHLCTKWGAVAKIRRLKERFPTILQQPRQQEKRYSSHL